MPLGGRIWSDGSPGGRDDGGGRCTGASAGRGSMMCRPMAVPRESVNHRFPSDPVVMLVGASTGSTPYGSRSTTPCGVMEPRVPVAS